MVKRVALVEDNDDNRALIDAILDGKYSLHEYVDGPSALAGMKQDPPDLILLDISLPGMDGTEVLGQIRLDEDLRALPVVALTAHALQRDRERFLALGFDAYVRKPIVEEEDLLEPVRRLLGGVDSCLSPQTRLRLHARYLQNLPTRLEVMLAVHGRLEAGDPTASADARTIGHQFSGTGTSFGMPQLSRGGRALEHAEDAELLQALGRLMEAVRAALQRQE